MRHVLVKFSWVMLGAGFIVVLLECLLRFLPVSMGLYRTTQFEKWPLQNSEPNLSYTYSISWAMLNPHKGKTNNYGHIAPFDFAKGSQPLIVLGDSFVESLMNDYTHTLQAQLGQRLDSRRQVYGLGASGLSAADYLALSSLARDEFRPTAAVIVLVDGDFSESLVPRAGHHTLVRDGDNLKTIYSPLAGDSTAKKIRLWIGEISLYRYFQVNLQFSTKQILKSLRDGHGNNESNRENSENNASDQRLVADLLLTQLPARLGLAAGCIVFLMDSDRYAIYKPDQASKPKDSAAVRQHFIEQALQRGFKVSDLDPVFRRRFAQNRVKFDHWPVDRHWNKVGHAIAADEAYRLLYGPDHQSSCDGGKQAALGS